MSDLTVLPTSEVNLRDSIVAEVEELLERAKAGELRSLAWYAEQAGSKNVSWNVVGTLSVTQTIGQLDVLRHTMLTDFTRRDE